MERGYLLLPEIRRQFGAGNYPAAYECALRAEQIGERFADDDPASGGQWPEAVAEAERATQRYLGSLGQRATGEARYRRVDIERLRGDLLAAEAGYREASECGRDPQPGLERIVCSLAQRARASRSLTAD